MGGTPRTPLFHCWKPRFKDFSAFGRELKGFRIKRNKLTHTDQFDAH